MSDISDTRTVEPLRIDRGLFLKVRCAYLRTMLARGETYAEAIDAINIHDHGQAQLLGMTDPRFDDGTVDQDILALVAAASPTQRRRRIHQLTNPNPKRKKR